MIIALSTAFAADILPCSEWYTEPGCYSSLSSALESAADGDVIYIDSGRLTEPVTLVDRELSLISFATGTTLWVTEDEPALTVEGGKVLVQGMTFVSEDGGAIKLVGGELTVLDSSFLPGVRFGDGGSIRAEKATLTVQNSSFEGGTVAGAGAHIYSTECTVEIQESSFEGGSGAYGGSVGLFFGSSRVEDSRFSGNEAEVGYAGALTILNGETKGLTSVVSGTTFEANVGAPAALWLGGYADEIVDNVFVENRSDSVDFYGYGIQSAVLVTSLTVEVRRNTFCGNLAETETVQGTTARVHATRARITNNVFLENYNGSLLVADAFDAQVWNNAFIGNTSPYGAELTLAEKTFRLVADVRRNLFAWNVDGYGGLGPILAFGDWHTISENHFWGNAPESVVLDQGDSFTGDPRLVNYIADGTCRIPGSIYGSDELWPAWDSPLRDAGSALSVEDVDPDGSRPDIGAFGGAEARNSPDWLDADADGVANLYDCAPLDPSVSPITTEIYYDGVDADCDGGSDYDADGDSQDAEAYGGLDCDDANPDAYLGAEELPYDGIDQSCDGQDLVDVDGDGYAAGVDCDDADARVFPGAPDDDLGVDWDCDGYGDPRAPLTQAGCGTPGAPVALLALLAAVGLRRRGAAPISRPSRPGPPAPARG